MAQASNLLLDHFQLTGINAIMYFAPGIFKNLGFDKNDADLLAQGINGIVNFLATVLAFFIVDRVGRRTLLIAGGLKYVGSGE
jgi:MFS family permease